MENRLDIHYGSGMLLRASLPLMAMMVVISIYSIVDGLFVSNLVGTTAFAALNLIWPALGVVGALGLMVGTGGSALVSKTLGEGDPERADRYFSMFVEFMLLLSVIMAIPLYIWMEPLSVALGAEGEMIEQCVIYGRICAVGMPAFMMQMGIQPFFMVAGRPRMGTRLSVASGLVNIGLDALFIIVFDWGLAGAAAGSMLACCVGGFYPVWYFSRGRVAGAGEAGSDGVAGGAESVESAGSVADVGPDGMVGTDGADGSVDSAWSVGTAGAVVSVESVGTAGAVVSSGSSGTAVSADAEASTESVHPDIRSGFSPVRLIKRLWTSRATSEAQPESGVSSASEPNSDSSLSRFFKRLWPFKSSGAGESRLHIFPTRMEAAPIASACTNGLSEFVGNISFNIVSMCYNLQLMHFYGENGVAAFSVILYFGFIFVAIYTGYNMTVTPLVGYNFGAENRGELRSLLRRSLAIMLMLGLVLFGLAEILARPVARLFVGYDAELTQLTVHATRIYSLCFLINGVNMFVSAWFTGLNNGPVSAAVSFSRTFIFELSCVFLLPVLFGTEGIWWSAPVADLLALLLGIGLIYKFRKRYL